jgi:hypothetical protein
MTKSKITKNIQLCNQGEGFFESILSQNVILHQVKGGNDVGIDYFCELINAKNESSNILFVIQLKTTRKDNVVLQKVENNSRLNKLDQYEIKRKNKKGGASGKYDNKSLIKDETLEYWKGFETPVYLFVAVIGNKNQLFYKRYTPILHSTQKRNNEKFYLVNNKNLFLAFIENNQGGFCRDLFIDYVRCNYKKGSLLYKSPKDFGLKQFSEDDFYKDLFRNKIYKDAFIKTRDKLNYFCSGKRKMAADGLGKGEEG